MGDIPLFPHGNTNYTIFSIKLLYNLTTLCLYGTLPCVDFMDGIMGDIPGLCGLPSLSRALPVFQTSLANKVAKIVSH